MNFPPIHPPGLVHLTQGGYYLKVHCVNLYYLVKQQTFD